MPSSIEPSGENTYSLIRGALEVRGEVLIPIEARERRVRYTTGPTSTISLCIRLEPDGAGASATGRSRQWKWLVCSM